jgi:pimeloyl-ACP methyl ester carboxylesterase
MGSRAYSFASHDCRRCRYSSPDPVKEDEMPQLSIGDVNLNYDSFGEGDPVLLVCGTGQVSMTWQLFQVPALTQAGNRVVTFDNRGIPPSDCPSAPYSVKEMAEDAAGLIEHLDLAPCRVAGLSLGALITQELALAHPALVRAAVMMGTVGRGDVFRKALTRSWVERAELDVRLPKLAEAIDVAFNLYSPFMLCDDERMRNYLDFAMAAPPWENPGRLGQFTADAGYDDRLADLAGIRVPSMVIGFELDVLTPAPLAREVAQAIPGCRYEEIPACGHAGPFEKPDEVNRLLMEFFAQH